jgi:protein-arginine kinase activator protein McsA
MPVCDECQSEPAVLRVLVTNLDGDLLESANLCPECSKSPRRVDEGNITAARS